LLRILFPHPIHVAQIDSSIRFRRRRACDFEVGFLRVADGDCGLWRAQRTVGSRSYHRHRVEVDYQSGSNECSGSDTPQPLVEPAEIRQQQMWLKKTANRQLKIFQRR
jgi:hypothetical protein